MLKSIQTTRRTQKASEPTVNMSAEEPEPNQTVAASEDATPAVDNKALTMEISQYVAERISTMMEKKFGDLPATLEKITTRLESNTKHITEAESRVSGPAQWLSSCTTRGIRWGSSPRLGRKDRWHMRDRPYSSNKIWLMESRKWDVLLTVCQRLIDMNIRFSMRFPATLCFSHGGKSHSFHSPKDALAYVDELSWARGDVKIRIFCSLQTLSDLS